MVLESLISPARAEKEPWELFFLGVLYSSVGVFLSLFIFGPSQMSLVMVFLTVLASAILMYNTLKFEGAKGEKIKHEMSLLREHSKALAFFIFLFLGFTVSFALWYVFLPAGTAQQIFSTQIEAIRTVSTMVLTGQGIGSAALLPVFFNNMKVLFFALFFSFFYGMGAIFILAWNASVVGAATGIFISNGLNKVAAATGSVGLGSYFGVISIGLARFLIHGIPEIGAYFVGGLAGGLISVAVINHRGHKPNFARVLKDAGVLTLIAVLLLAIAALLEVFVTPIFY